MQTNFYQLWMTKKELKFNFLKTRAYFTIKSNVNT